MKAIIKFYHFLGGIQFAIILIAAVALVVLAGTFLESYTESHRYASHFTYGNPLFAVLLGGFFVNILFSALRRWPFKSKHIPFLITHLGLLMILGGALAKSYFGIQGNMGIMEGSGSHEILLPDTYSVLVESRTTSSKRHFPLKRNFFGHLNTDLAIGPELKIELKEYQPHAKETMETWFKGQHAIISGLKPFAVYDADDQTVLPISSRAALSKDTVWDIMALRSSNVASVSEKAYIQGMKIRLTDPRTQTKVFEGNLEEALRAPLVWNGGSVTAALELSKSSLKVDLHMNGHYQPEKITIALSGEESLINKNTTSPHLGHPPLLVDLERTPLLAFIQDPEQNIHLFAFDPWGRVFTETFPSENLSSLIVYDQGFAGYAVQTEIPFAHPNLPRESLEQTQLDQIEQQLRSGLNTTCALAPPLQLLHAACADSGTDFIQCTLEFLKKGNQSPRWILVDAIPLSDDLQKTLLALNWQDEKKACQWICALCEGLEGEMEQGEDFLIALKSKGWPFVDRLEAIRERAGPCQGEEIDQLMTTLARQIFAISGELPQMPDKNYSNARLLSAYFRTYGLHLSNFPVVAHDPESFILECPITTRHPRAAPQSKLEENLPKITLKVSDGPKTEYISLLYDRYGIGLKWPILGGKYRLRFQPEAKEIPYHLRLHHARQTNYASSMQPYSYESDVTIIDRALGKGIEKTISMNNVHETWEGHRFYMASLAPSDNGAVKSVQIVVNHDPAKYWLTYPGAILVSLGILLLFWMWPYRLK